MSEDPVNNNAPETPEENKPAEEKAPQTKPSAEKTTAAKKTTAKKTTTKKTTTKKEPASASKAQAAEACDVGSQEECECRCRLLSAVEGNLDDSITWLRNAISKEKLDGLLRWSQIMGHRFLFLAAILALVCSIVVGVKAQIYNIVFYGIAVIIITPILFYTAIKFLKVAKEMITSNPTRLCSDIFLNCFALVVAVVGIFWLTIDIINAIQLRNFAIMMDGLVAFFVMLFLACVALNPETLNITIDKNIGAGESAVSIFAFFIKAGLKIIPFIYAVTIFVGALGLLVAIIDAFASQEGMNNIFSKELKIVMDTGVTATIGILWAATLPFFGVIWFMFNFLIIDLIDAVLSLNYKKK